jgi:hypothetical protein
MTLWNGSGCYWALLESTSYSGEGRNIGLRGNMNSQSGKYRFLSESRWQGFICTVPFFLFVSYLEFFGGSPWLGVTGIVITCVSCYFFCYFGARFGKKFIPNPYLGGYLGGLVGILVNIVFWVGLIYFMVTRPHAIPP